MNSKKDTVWIWFKAAFADGTVQDEEKKVLFDLAARLDLEMSEIAEIWEACSQGKTAKIKLPKTYEEKQALLNGLIKVILADDEVTRNEDLFIRRIAQKIGMEAEVDDQRAIWGESRWPKY